MYNLKSSREITFKDHKINVKNFSMPFDTLEEAYKFGKEIANRNTNDEVFIYITKDVSEEFELMLGAVEKDWYIGFKEPNFPVQDRSVDKEIK